MSDKKINVSSLINYGLAAIVPILILFGFRVFYTMGYGHIVPNTLLMPQILLNGLASLAFFYYLKHSSKMEMEGTGFPLLFSAGYGLCSYAFMQESDMGYLLLFALLPILFLSLEYFVKEGKTLLFILLLALCLCINTTAGIALTIYLLAAFWTEQEKEKGEAVAEFLHFILLCLFSLLLSAAFSLPGLKEAVKAAKDYTYPGFDATAPTANFFSRLLLGGVTWQVFPQWRGLHLYFGLFFLLCFILYFVNHTFVFKARIKSLVFTLFLLCTLAFLPAQYLMELGAPTSFTVFYAAFPVFWFLKTAAQGFTELLSLSKKRLCIGGFLWALLILFALSGSYLNFHTLAAQSNILFMVLYILVILGLFSKYFDKTASLLLPCLICLELFCNIFISSNQNFIPNTLTIEDQFIWKQTSFGDEYADNSYTTAETASEADASLAAYENFNKEHDASGIYQTLNILFDHVGLTEEELFAAQEYGLLNNLEQCNAMARKIGAESDLFTPVSITISPRKSDLYKITDEGNQVFNLEFYILEPTPLKTALAFDITSEKDCTIYLYDDLSNQIYLLDLKANESSTAYFLFNYSKEISYNFRLLGYEMDQELLQQVLDQMVSYQAAQQGTASMGIYYLGAGLSCLGIFLLLLFYLNSDKKRLILPLQNIKTAVAQSHILQKIFTHLKDNYVYWLALIIPPLLFLLTMIYYSCIPFGKYSFFDQDGLHLTLPSTLDWYYNLKEGSMLYSMNGGYGYSLYANNPMGFLYYPLTILKPGQVGPAILFGEGLCLGLSAFTMIYYLTHRLWSRKANKKDYRLLIPGLVYALNTYMLVMHGFTSWYPAYAIFPLLILSFEFLMEKKRYGTYIILLALMMYSNWYLALYSCIFLVLYFFTCRFQSVRDFFMKGFRFATCSLLGTGCSFFIIFNTLMSTRDSYYNGQDSVFPTFGFHTSFFDQWKQLMIFSDSAAVDSNDGGISMFMGILTLLLVLLYFSSKRIKGKDKLKRLPLIVILFISFNGQVLSFLWNGLHYQTKVPNRYVFLLMFLCAAVAYDGLIELKKTTLKKGLICCSLLAVFFAICQFLGEGNSRAAFYITLVLLLFYGLLLCIRKKLARPVFMRLLCMMLFAELTINMFYFTSTYGLDAIPVIAGYDKQEAFFNETLNPNREFYRVSTPVTFISNTGSIYNFPSGSVFNSLVTLHQTNLAVHYGFFAAANFTSLNFNGTPFSLALAGYQYILLPQYATTSLPDLDQYEYLGHFQNAYIYRVPHTLSLGFYAPEGILNLHEHAYFVPYFLNDLVTLYTKDSAKELFSIQSLKYSEDPDSTPNSFRFLDTSHNMISYEEACAILEEESSSSTSTRNLYLDLNFDPASQGYVYFYLLEFIPIGKSSDTDALRTSIAYPNASAIFDSQYNYVVFNEEVFEEFYEAASAQQMENVKIEGNRISGTTNYKEDGYTILSLPYERGFKAYLDGKEVEILDPYESFMVIKTPKGSHTIELVYTPYGMKTGLLVTAVSIILSCLLCFWVRKRQQSPSPEKQQTK